MRYTNHFVSPHLFSCSFCRASSRFVGLTRFFFCSPLTLSKVNNKLRTVASLPDVMHDICRDIRSRRGGLVVSSSVNVVVDGVDDAIFPGIIETVSVYMIFLHLEIRPEAIF